MSSSLLLAALIVSGVVYHLAQKVSGAASPWPMLAVAYGAAFAVALALALRAGSGGRWQPGRGEMLAGLLIGLAAFGVEASFFFLYRSGWPLATASVIASVSVTAILAVIGIALFGEHLTLARLAGIAFAVGGAGLIARG
jgi:drug/metabolite transporter (DMT)-like permease